MGRLPEVAGPRVTPRGPNDDSMTAFSRSNRRLGVYGKARTKGTEASGG